ncbi:putative carotenoid cleavage dioxygenase 4 [Hibiscus syriacus]|uniref:Carotenoid cleavage dioxygenase 4 n=1 Tax=Hibiscus syriacus TaxID=106335 RepID=A0A6A2X594_HIBSY|nr:putative carotenoid cleavage dioxygenase 4 [Hibiscus syriacus]
MDAFSSAFLSTVAPSTKSPSTAPPSYVPRRYISSVRIDKKPPTSTTKTPPSVVAKERVEPKLSTMIFNTFDDIINNFIDPPPRPSVDPRHVLSHNFAPVDELAPMLCEVIQGSLPPCLDGAYILNGPNPQFLPRGPYHLFDGDGMLHSIRISNGNATLCSRYVKTNNLTVVTTRGALMAIRILFGEFNPANRIGDLQTLGRVDFDGKLFMSMTAHPKIEAETGEAFAFRFVHVPPYVKYFYFEANGNKKPDVPILSMTRPSFIHDFAITNKYAIFADIQMGINPMNMIFGGGFPVGVHTAKMHRIGVIHDGNAIIMLAPNILTVQLTLEKVRIDLGTVIVTRHPVSARNLDFAVLNPAYVGKNNYLYAAVGDPMLKIAGVAKLDVSNGDHQERTVANRMYGPCCFGGEPFFVAREPENPEADEEDGYLISHVHNENTGESRFLVMDAKSPTLDIVAAVKLPHRVPYGFHVLFVRERDLKRL